MYCVKNTQICLECFNNPTFQKIYKQIKELYKIIPDQNFCQFYKPVCPRGFNDCVNDPGYIQFYYPNQYKELYGDRTPEEAIYTQNGCWDSFQRDPEMIWYCYDDEDK